MIRQLLKRKVYVPFFAAMVVLAGCRTADKEASEPVQADSPKLATFNPNAVKPTPLPPIQKKVEPKVPSDEFPPPEGLPEGLYAELLTDAGSVVIRLDPERAPMTVANFVGLAEGTKYSMRQGNRFYDGTVFHRVVHDFVVQGGDPTGTGTGGPGYAFPDEFHPQLRHDRSGVVSMANSGPNTNGSQFFITMKATPWLDDRHSIFGQVVRGQENLFEIKQGSKLQAVKIHRIGEKYADYLATQSYFDSLKNAAIERDPGKIRRDLRDRRVPQKR
jgi:peptidylprolyl isomerase